VFSGNTVTVTYWKQLSHFKYQTRGSS